MITEVYADLYFLINTCMDLLCLMITGALLHRRTHRLRAILAAALGGAYALIALLFSLDGLSGILLDAAVALAMCAITFSGKGTTFPSLLKAGGVHVLVSMILGGVMTVLYTLLNRLHLPLDTLHGDGLSVWMFALLSAVAGVMTACGGKFFGLSGKTRSVTVHATIFGTEITLRALVDSGNLLRDPVSGRAVIVADRTLLCRLLPDELARLLSDPLGERTGTFASRLRLIPAGSATGDALLPAILPEQLTVTDGKSTFDGDYLLAAAELGNRLRGFDAVIPLE